MVCALEWEAWVLHVDILGYIWMCSVWTQNGRGGWDVFTMWSSWAHLVHGYTGRSLVIGGVDAVHLKWMWCVHDVDVIDVF